MTLISEAGRKKGKTETKQTAKKKRAGECTSILIHSGTLKIIARSFPATNSSDDEAKETPKAASGAGAGNGPVSAANKGKKQKVIQDKENRKAIKVIIIRTHTYTFISV